MDSFFLTYFAALIVPLSVLLYILTPKKAKPYYLILISWAVFFFISGKTLLYLLLTIAVTFLSGLKLDKIQALKADELSSPPEGVTKKEIKAKYRKKQRGVLALAAAINILVLAVLKYSPFFLGNINSIISLFGSDFVIPIPKLAAPIGISFYTLEAISYLSDIYNEKIKADKNIFRLTLFLSFFPHIIEGPICRYGETAGQLWDTKPIKSENAFNGMFRILFGLFKKIVIADRLNVFIQSVYGSPESYDGGIIALSAVAYTLQLYSEFSGTIDVVLGTGKIFGIELAENFRQPFFSKTISEFWKRWHITLGTWFRDYIFYPVSMSSRVIKLTKKSRKRFGNHLGPVLVASIALFCVWICNGLWHGSGWQYIFFGMYHFFLIELGNIIEPTGIKITEKLHIDREGKFYTVFCIIRSAVLVCIGEMFFRAEGLRTGFKMFGIMVTRFSFKSFADGTFMNIGLDINDIVVLAVSLSVVFVFSILAEKGKSPLYHIGEKPMAVRWLVYFILIFAVIIFGAYGGTYAPLDPIYADF